MVSATGVTVLESFLLLTLRQAKPILTVVMFATRMIWNDSDSKHTRYDPQVSRHVKCIKEEKRNRRR